MKFLDFYINHFDNFKDFLLTIQMVEKNDYQNCKVLYNNDTDGVTGLCIYSENSNNINIEVLEIRKDCRHQHIGSELINKVKQFNKPIFLTSMPNTCDFYKKHGFTETSEKNVFEYCI